MTRAGVRTTAAAERVLVLGATGFLGANVVRSVIERGDAVVRHTRGTHGRVTSEELHADLLDPLAVAQLVDASAPDVVVNCAALADVDRCEAEPDLSRALNVDLPRRLALTCAERGIELVHVSTDAVFDGIGGPFDESARPRPLSTYGRDKFAGETAVLAAHPAALVARTNIVGWSPTGRRSLLEHFHDRLAVGEAVPGFVDLAFRPLPVPWFWPTCAALRAAGAAGVRHVTGPELLTKHAFGQRVALAFGFDPDLVVPVDSTAVARAATRAATLDVLPSPLLSGTLPDARTLDDGLAELCADAERGVRDELTRLLTEGDHL